jgi:hypothetical protein
MRKMGLWNKPASRGDAKGLIRKLKETRELPGQMRNVREMLYLERRSPGNANFPIGECPWRFSKRSKTTEIIEFSNREIGVPVGDPIGSRKKNGGQAKISLGAAPNRWLNSPAFP